MQNRMPDWAAGLLETVGQDELSVTWTDSTDAGRGESRSAIVSVRWNGPPGEADRVWLRMKVDPEAKLVWKPHLCPQDGMVIGDSVFRSPAVIFERGAALFALIPDLRHLGKRRQIPHVMDYVLRERELFYGLAHYEKHGHVYHRLTNRRFPVHPGRELFRFYIVLWDGAGGRRTLTPVGSWLWGAFARPDAALPAGAEAIGPAVSEALRELEPYVTHAYDWAFRRWGDLVWHEFELDGKAVGGCVFIVRARQAPGLGMEVRWRERKSIWNQAWFCSLRSAYGYRLWGEARRDADLVRRANLAKQFALAAPLNNGLFPSVFAADDQGKWENGRWGFSDRRPPGHDEYAHLLDMSWTCLWMLKWYRDIEADTRLLEYAQAYAERLLSLQDESGSFPAWIHPATGDISAVLRHSPETSMHALLLARLYAITGNSVYLAAAEKAMAFVRKVAMPEGRWEDFETYWSCAAEWEGKREGAKDARSGLYNQCTFSMYWTAEAFKELYAVTGKADYLADGEKALSELSLYQSVWNPAYMSIPALGGFGVMNSDDEWNDARQSLFALTYFGYYGITGKREYAERGLWAMKASFYMMYCPENPEVRQLYERKHPFFGERDYGFEMENAHHGGDSDDGIVGEFAIFDWGNGAASSSLAELLFRIKPYGEGFYDPRKME
ncbi:hypothetical protein [Paenibacillus sp. GYB003]|uniref:hypothetical protein n=1 Tax=Paenibacillus sp. GYB003 TaxID=2994392 RepID=UPI002F964C3D